MPIYAYPWLNLSTHPACGDAFMNTHMMNQTSLVSKGLEANLTGNHGINNEIFKVLPNSCDWFLDFCGIGNSKCWGPWKNATSNTACSTTPQSALWIIYGFSGVHCHRVDPCLETIVQRSSMYLAYVYPPLLSLSTASADFDVLLLSFHAHHSQTSRSYFWMKIAKPNP